MAAHLFTYCYVTPLSIRLRIIVCVLRVVLAVVMSNLPEHVWFPVSVLPNAVPVSVRVVCIAPLLFGSVCSLCH